MRKLVPFFCLLISFHFSCKNKPLVDTLLINGVFIDSEDAQRPFEAVAIKAGKILETGRAADLKSRYKSKETIDLNGAFVYPGFIDGHAHFLGLGMFLNWCDLTDSKSLDEVIERLKQHAKRADTGWLRGRGWDQNLWDDKQLPDNELLSKAFPDRPVLLKRVDGHAALANDVALQLAGVNRNSAIAGGEVVLINGKPSGLLIDNAVEMVERAIPAYSEDEKREMLHLAQEVCFSLGLTSVVDCGLDKEDILLIKKMQEEGELDIRLMIQVSANDDNLRWLETLKKPIYTDKLNVRALKCYYDGALGSRGALLKADYHDHPGNRGLQLTSDDKFFEIAEWAEKHGYQLCTHAIGDSANSKVLMHYSGFLTKPNDLRWRIEHAQVVSPEERGIFAEHNIIPSMQPTHATSDMGWAGERLGTERLQGAYSLKSLMNQNGWIVLGTDFPVEAVHPFYTFYTAVFRKHPITREPAEGFLPDEALTRIEALKGMTIWAAAGSFEEQTRGRIAPGYWADFTILDINLLEADEDAIATVLAARQTWVGGKRVFINQLKN